MIQSSRIVARALKQSAFAMRSLSGVPDTMTVRVLSRRADGKYLCQRPDWPQGITMVVPTVPSNALLPTNSRQQIFFEDGDRNRPFLYWPWGRPRKHGLLGAAGLLWSASLGRLGGQRSVRTPSGVTPTDMSGPTVSALATASPGHLRSTAAHLYWPVSEGSDLTLYRSTPAGVVESQTWSGLGLGDLCTLIGPGRLVVSTGSTSAALLQWGQLDPVWSVDYDAHFTGDLWADAITRSEPDPEDEGENREVLLLPYRDSSPGWIKILAADGTFFSQHQITLVDGSPFPSTNPESANWLHEESDQVLRSDEWEQVYLSSGDGGARTRGLFVAGDTLVPALFGADQVLGLDPVSGAVSWSHEGWAPFDRAGIAVGEVTHYERYTVVACTDSRVLVFVARFGLQKIHPPQERQIDVDWPLDYYMAQSAIDEIGDDSTTYVAEESFDGVDFWNFWPPSSPSGAYSAAVSAMADAYTNGPLYAIDEDEELVLSQLQYGYRVLDAATGETVSDWWLRELDGPSLDGSRTGATEDEIIEVSTGLPQVRSTTQTINKESWVRGSYNPSDPQAWYPDAWPSPVDLTSIGITSSLQNKMHYVYRLSGQAHVPYQQFTSQNSPEYDPSTDGTYFHLTPWADSLPTYSYQIDFVNWDDPLNDALVDLAPYLAPYTRFGFERPGDQESPDDDDLEWLADWTTAEVAVYGYDYETTEVPLIVDAAPRWDAVRAVLVGDKVIFPPGHRNLPGSSGGGIGVG